MQQMRHTFRVVRGTGLAAVVIAFVWASAGPSSAARPKPHLRLLDRAPLTLKGTYFRARERVRVTVTTTETQTRVVRASRVGSFTTQFDNVTIGRCGGLAVRAVGAQGAQATLKVLQAPDCAPGLGP
jgi:hypothetical protein